VSVFADAQFGVIKNQQPLSSNHHPRHLAPSPHVTTIPNSHGRSQPLLTTYNHDTRPPTAVWQCHATSSNNHHQQQPQTMNNTQMMKNTHKRIRMTL